MFYYNFLGKHVIDLNFTTALSYQPIPNESILLPRVQKQEIYLTTVNFWGIILIQLRLYTKSSDLSSS